MYAIDSMNRNDIVILKIKNADCHCIISGISKSRTINFLKIINLTEKVVHYKILYQKQFFKLQTPFKLKFEF